MNGQSLNRDVGDQALDAATVAFAAWTLACQLIVAAEGSAWALAAAGGLAALAAAVAWMWRPALQTQVLDLFRAGISDIERPPESGPNPATLSSARPVRETMGVVLVALALAAATAVLVEVNAPWALLPAVAGLTLGLINGRRENSPNIPVIGGRWITVLCIVVAIAATGIMNRPDHDDAFYLGIANSVADRPADPVLKYDTLHGVPGLEVSSEHHRLRTLEPLIGEAALLTGLAPIAWAHWIFPLVGAIGLVLAHRRLLRYLAPDRWPWALAATMVVLLTIGDAHCWHGNFGLVRLHQGKGVLVSVLIPLAIAAAIEFARRPTVKGWILLAAVQVAAIGVNPTAIGLIPLVVGCSLGAAVALNRDGLRALVIGGQTSIYPVAVGLMLRSGLAPDIEHSIADLDSVDLVVRAAGLVLGTGVLPVVMAFVAVIAWATVPAGPGRRVLAALPLAFALVFNPWLAHAFAGLATGAQTFWRVFWLVPAPAMLGIAATSPLALRRLAWPVRVGGTVAVVVACAFALPTIQLTSAYNYVRFAPFELKVPVRRMEVGQAVARLGSPGSLVLVPRSLGTWVTIWPNHPCPLMVRKDYLHFGDLQEQQRRRFMTDWVSGVAVTVADRSRFLEGLDIYSPTVVCLSRKHPAHQWWVGQAKMRGYVLEQTIRGNELWRLSDLVPINLLNVPEAQSGGPGA
ncbi:MAG: hypothetical protein DRJ65_15465 [Acidobacteria bacterium]|nr:MAG: hypothetical protein DRJ65_15465 [Acidobacteriota bacterium]